MTVVTGRFFYFSISNFHYFTCVLSHNAHIVKILHKYLITIFVIINNSFTELLRKLSCFVLTTCEFSVKLSV